MARVAAGRKATLAHRGRVVRLGGEPTTVQGVRLKRMEAVSLVASLISALATAVLGFLAFRLTRSSNRNAAERAIGDLANSLARLRVEYPEAIALARRWQPDDWERL